MKRHWPNQAVKTMCPCPFRHPITHTLNSDDFPESDNAQGYQVYQCDDCGAYWGCRHQHQPGTGSDNRWKKFTGFDDIKRHC